jgi:hypothetical protein
MLYFKFDTLMPVYGIFKMRYFCLKTALIAVSSLVIPNVAIAGGINQFIGLGDSTMDSGYFRYTSTGGSPGPAATGGTPAAVGQMGRSPMPSGKGPTAHSRAPA